MSDEKWLKKYRKFPENIEVLKKWIVFKVKNNKGEIKEIKRPIDMYHSHRSCIIDDDKVIKEIRTQQKAEVQKLKGEKRESKTIHEERML